MATLVCGWWNRSFGFSLDFSDKMDDDSVHVLYLLTYWGNFFQKLSFFYWVSFFSYSFLVLYPGYESFVGCMSSRCQFCVLPFHSMNAALKEQSSNVTIARGEWVGDSGERGL